MQNWCFSIEGGLVLPKTLKSLKIADRLDAWASPCRKRSLFILFGGAENDILLDYT